MDPATVEKAEEEDDRPKDIQGIPPIHQVINIDDFEVCTALGMMLRIENIAEKC